MVGVIARPTRLHLAMNHGTADAVDLNLLAFSPIALPSVNRQQRKGWTGRWPNWTVGLLFTADRPPRQRRVGAGAVKTDDNTGQKRRCGEDAIGRCRVPPSSRAHLPSVASRRVGGRRPVAQY